jgi:hypothetical protein
MSHQDRRSNLRVIWESVGDPNARYRVRRAVELILSNRQKQMKPSFDRHRWAGHDEEVLVGNDNEINSTQ